MKKFNIIAERPDYPENWIICNAPRPIIGDKLFDGDFVHGRFYASIDPDGIDAEICIRENTKLDAWELVYHTIDQAKDAIKNKYPKYADRVDKLDEIGIRESFRSIMNK